jgi:cobyrinic acid a,c-diamide synthase
MTSGRHAFLISAAHKSSGKTTVSIGLCAALHARGLAVQPFKKGPDYIDPMWLGLAADRPCRNLDIHLSGIDAIRAAWSTFIAHADVGLLEGTRAFTMVWRSTVATAMPPSPAGSICRSSWSSIAAA